MPFVSRGECCSSGSPEPTGTSPLSDAARISRTSPMPFVSRGDGRSSGSPEPTPSETSPLSDAARGEVVSPKGPDTFALSDCWMFRRIGSWCAASAWCLVVELLRRPRRWNGFDDLPDLFSRLLIELATNLSHATVLRRLTMRFAPWIIIESRRLLRGIEIADGLPNCSNNLACARAEEKWSDGYDTIQINIKKWTPFYLYGMLTADFSRTHGALSMNSNRYSCDFGCRLSRSRCVLFATAQFEWSHDSQKFRVNR